MAEYSINKGIGGSVEFKGLKAQYLFVFVGGLLVVFILFVIMYMIGISQWFCIGFGVLAASVLVWLVFALNAKYGEYGLMKLTATKSHPKYIINRRKLIRLFTSTKTGK
jgi:predicted membrane chloride channel (bestrophin family)